jgi:hypothetical protein
MSGDREKVHRLAGQPPSDEAFDQLAGSPAPGDLCAGLLLPGLPVAFSRMDEEWHRAFLARYGPYAADLPAGSAPTLTLAAGRTEVEHWVRPPSQDRMVLNPVFVEAHPEGATGHFQVRVCTYNVAARFRTDGGIGPALFARTDFEPRERSIENILRVAIAWLAATRGGLLMHAASIERDGRAWIFFGQSGAGKSTLAALSRRGRVISDDLTLLLPGQDGRLEVVGSPFRGTYAGGPPVLGRFPVAAALRLRKAGPGEASSVEPLEPARALPDAFANLPFVVDQLHTSPELFASLETRMKSLPMHVLRFTLQGDSFWDAIEAAGA